MNMVQEHEWSKESLHDRAQNFSTASTVEEEEEEEEETSTTSIFKK